MIVSPISDIITFAETVSEVMMEQLNVASINVGLRINTSMTNILCKHPTVHSCGGRQNDRVYGRICLFGAAQSAWEGRTGRRIGVSWEAFGKVPFSLKRVAYKQCIQPVTVYDV